MSYPSTVQAIADVLRPELIVPDPLELQEGNPSGQQRPVRVLRSEGALCICFDRGRARIGAAELADWLYPLLRVRDVPRKSCDFIVFHERDDKLYVLMFELKSQHAGEARKQIAYTRLLVDYLLEFLRFSGVDLGTPTYRGIVLKAGVRPKKRSRDLNYEPTPNMPDLGCTTLPVRDYHLALFCR